jgi:DNA replication protein DnaC
MPPVESVINLVLGVISTPTSARALAQESCWVQNHEHIFMLGPTGVGKSYVASALAQKACRDGYSVYYTRATGLFRDLNLARADGSLRQLLKRLNQ